MITPSVKLLRLLALGAPLWVVVTLFPPLVILPLVWMGGLIGAALVDYRSRPKPDELSVERELPSRISYDEESTVQLRFGNRWKGDVQIVLRDEVPDPLNCSEQIFEFSLSPGQTQKISYTVKPTRRGRFQFSRALSRVEWGRRLLVKTYTFDCPR